MVAGHLQEKNDFYYIVLSYKDAAGKRKTKWEATGLSVKRNKKKAEALLLERRRNFMVPTAPAEIRLFPTDSTGELLKFLLERIHGENGLPMQDLRDCCHSITFKIGDKKRRRFV